jgi:adenosylmethionine-8-amino-7-oxononanoate aminotransferase
MLYISDEVVTAWGRLGHWFSSEDVFDIKPDMITTAKGITSGYQPLGALFISDELIKRISGDDVPDSYFSNGFTYSGHPVACVAALKNIEIMERENLMEHAREVGPYLQSRLQELLDIPIVGNVRGMGMLGCVECVVSQEGREPLELDYDVGNRINAHCQELGLFVRPLINMCVFSPPLIINKEEIDILVDTLRIGIERTMDDIRKEGVWSG